MNYPKNILQLIQQIVVDNTDIDKAIDIARTRIKKHPDYEQLIETLIDQAISDMVYRARHTINNAIKREAGSYNSKPKIVIGKSPAVRKAMKSLYAFNINGTSLGKILGSELLSIAKAEEDRGAGHYRNAQLCRALAQIVPANRTVQDAVSIRRLQALFKDIYHESEAA